MFQEKISVNEIVISKLLGKVCVRTHDKEEVIITSTEEENVSIATQGKCLVIQTKVEENEKQEKKGLFQSFFGNKNTINVQGSQTVIIGNGNVVINNGVVVQNGHVQDLATVDMTILVPKDLITCLNVSGQIHVDVYEITEELDVDSSGQVSVCISDVPNVCVDTSGQSVTTVQNVTMINADISGQSKLHIKARELNKVKIDLSGQSNAHIEATTIHKVNGDVSGMSRLVVFGQVIKKDVDTSGLSSVSFQ